MSAVARSFVKPPDYSVFGLTGGIGCGKSFVASILVKNLIPVIDADQCARDVVVPGSMGLELLVEAFGDILKDGALDRPKLAELVFGKAAELLKLSAIMHPLIAEHAAYLIRMHLLAGCHFVCYDAALIVELGLANQFQPLVVVSCSAETQLARLLKRGLSEEQARARMASQISSEKRLEYADVIIDTNGSKDETQIQVEALVDSLTS